MSLDGLRVNHGELDAAAQNMYATVQKLDETLNNLENDIAPKVATWSGSQQEAYRVSKAAWDWAMQEMRDLLDKSHQSVYQSNADYMAADKRGAARFEF
ncbi:WXG100 family type VII secretion target [Nocardioides sp. zg-536]|uniref:ESAT-6-like protein n=1 Tax=Nocardioides faecalis TaxID=2803858 RepID=A0A938YCW3_9ACTN|nr:WXG100 family type VII secretion target [Nocardioides faecalis]MBM9461691.1 WXG100 family type VII secretion target [Nocardioides faecalis]MBS4752107.1 WXG100 family type VII secretion target [Nocardioides faecalis]QVI59083.1 WXG100 family type VII secretion target [Nocardioides faecalis]